MYQNSQINFKAVSLHKFFNLIKQMFPQLPPFDLTHLKRIYNNFSINPTSIAIADNKITTDLLANLISEQYETSICSFEELLVFYSDIIAIISKDHQHFDEGVALNLLSFGLELDEESFLNYKEKIVNQEMQRSIKEVHSYEETMITIEHWLSSIYSFSSQKFRKDILPHFLFASKELLFNKYYVDNYTTSVEGPFFRALLFICEAAHQHSEVASELLKSAFLDSSSFKNIYANAMQNLPEKVDNSTQIALIGFTNLYLRANPENIAIIADLLKNQNASKRLIDKSLSMVHNHEFMQQLLQLYTRLLKLNYNIKPSYFEANNLTDIQVFAIKVLRQQQHPLFYYTIRLIREVVKYNLGNYHELEDVRIVFGALYSYDMRLKRESLLVWETALRVGNKVLKDTFLIERDQYMNTIINFLSQPFKEGVDSLHCVCLEIIYLMIQPQFFLCLDYFIKCLEVALQTHPCLYTFISEIFKKLCQTFLSSELTSAIIKSDSIVRLSLELLVCCYDVDNCAPIIDSSFAQFKFFNIQLLTNTLQSLYLLFLNRHMIKDLDIVILMNLYDAFGNILYISQESAAIRGLIREEMVICPNKKKSRVCGMIFIICENILFSLKNVSDPKTLLKKRKTLLAMLYQLLSLKELEEEKIPIMVEYHIEFELFRPLEIERLLPITLSFQAFKSYCFDVIKSAANKESFREEISAIKFRDTEHGNAEIKSEGEYLRMIDRIKKGKKEFVHWIKMEKDNSPVDLNSAGLIQSASIFNTMNTYYSSRNSPISRRTATEVTNYRSRSPSPFQQTNSLIIPNQNLCDICKQPSPNRLCFNCNRR